MKRLLVFALAGVMLFATPVMAAEEAAKEVAAADDVDDGDDGDDGDYVGDDDESGGSLSPSSSTIKPKPDREDPVQEVSTPAVEASSIPEAVIQAAAAEGKTVGEYLNNAVVTIPGLENAVPIGQGGHVIINGAPSNHIFSVLKPTLANVNSAKVFAASLNGKVLTVVQVKAPVNGFRTARVNFYMQGIKAGQNIKVFQISNGQWWEVDVAEVRADHVVVDMTSLGTLAFIEVPN